MNGPRSFNHGRPLLGDGEGRSINLDILAEMRVAALDLPKTGKRRRTSRFLRIRSVERQRAGVGRLCALGRQDVAPREASGKCNAW